MKPLKLALVSLFMIALSAACGLGFTWALYAPRMVWVPLDIAIFLAATGAACCWGLILLMARMENP